MKVPFNWLREYVDISLTPEELAERLTMAGIEIDSLSIFAPLGERFIAARIEKIEEHRHASNLHIVNVSTGTTTRKIVCGARNINVGDMVPLALPGAVLPGGAEIRESEIKGVLSAGMLCSAGELGLEIVQDNVVDGILILEKGSNPGDKLIDLLYVKEPVLEFATAPNRGDCLSMLGVAREVAALTGSSVRVPEINLVEDGHTISDLVTIALLEPALCYRYTARMMENFRIAPSPLNMQLRLLAAGVRAIHNLVDVTNYVMWETGFPMHAFDYDCIEGKKIVVRRASQGETLVTLDGACRNLDPEMLVIADAAKPVGLAGVMGGENTEITRATQRLFLEAACFNPINNRRTARLHNLPSEASIRYEKGVDPEMAVYAQNRAVSLMRETAGGLICRGILDLYPHPFQRPNLRLRAAKVKEMLGYAVHISEMERILIKLGMDVQVAQNSNNPAAAAEAVLNIGVPSFRPDLGREIDLIEEIARVKGYDKIPVTLPEGVITSGRMSLQKRVLSKITDTMIACGLQEVITYSFMHSQSLDALSLVADAKRRHAVILQNPLSEDQEIMRTTIIPNLLRLLHYNFNRQVDSQFVYELGKVYYPMESETDGQSKLPRESLVLALAITGKLPQNWQASPRDVDFYTLKGILERLLQNLGIDMYHWHKSDEPFLHPHQAVNLVVNGAEIGCLGRIRSSILENFSLRQDVFIAEIELDSLLAQAKLEPQYKILPRFPAVWRDIAFVVSSTNPAASLMEEIKKTGGTLLESINLFDVYRGNQIPEGYTSLAFALTFRHPERTLKDEEVDKIMRELEQQVSQKCGGLLRKI